MMSEAQATAEEKVRAREESEWRNVLLFGYVQTNVRPCVRLLAAVRTVCS